MSWAEYTYVFMDEQILLEAWGIVCIQQVVYVLSSKQVASIRQMKNIL